MHGVDGCIPGFESLEQFFWVSSAAQTDCLNVTMGVDSRELCLLSGMNCSIPDYTMQIYGSIKM